MRQPGDGRMPADILTLLNTPLDGRRRARINAARGGTAELGPIGRGAANGPKDSQENSCSA